MSQRRMPPGEPNGRRTAAAIPVVPAPTPAAASPTPRATSTAMPAVAAPRATTTTMPAVGAPRATSPGLRPATTTLVPGRATTSVPIPAALTRTGTFSAPRTTTTIALAQTAVIRIEHLAESLCADTRAVRRSLPDVAAEALEICGKPSADAAALEKTLSRDPFISAQLISVANSPIFAPRMPILGVRDAAVRIGLDAVRDVVLMVVTSSTMFRVPGFDAEVDALRRRMLTSAAAARLLAKRLRVESEYGFLAGLLHDIGQLILLERCVQEGILTPALYADPVEGPPLRDLVHAHHTRVGAATCRAWKLPPGVIEAAEFHHDHRAGGKPRFAAHLIAAADVIASHLLGDPGAPVPNTSPLLAELSLKPPQIDEVLKAAETECSALIAATGPRATASTRS